MSYKAEVISLSPYKAKDYHRRSHTGVYGRKQAPERLGTVRHHTLV